MSFAQFLSILKARWKWAVSTFFLTVTLVVLLSLVWPKRYTADAVVVVDPKPDPVSAALYSNLMLPGLMSTQVEIFESERVALRVVSNLRMAESVQTRIEWQDDTDGVGSIEAWLANRVSKYLKVKPSRESNLISLSYTADDPKQAAFMANAYVQAFLDTNLDLRTDPAKQYSAFFVARSKQLRSELEQSQAKLSAYQKEHGIIATDERLDIENARLNDLSTQLVSLQAMSAESASRKRQARGAADQLQDSLSNPLIASLRADLSREEARYKQLSASLGDNHPSLQQSRASIAEIKSRIGAEVARIGGGAGVSDAINQSREASVRAALEEQRAKVLQMKEQRDQVAVLVKDVENAQKAYDSVATRLSQTSLESENKLPNVAVLTSASEPLKPSSPNLILNTAVALLLALPLAVAAALIVENRDRRVRTLDDLRRTLQIGVIGTLQSNHAGRKALFGNKRLPSLGQQLLRPLPGAAANK